MTVCGVRDFTSANDQVCHLPAWKAEALRCTLGDVITVRLVDLPKGTYVRFRALEDPSSSETTSGSIKSIPDHRAAFESYLRSHFTTLATGEVIQMRHGSSSYSFLVEELKPAHAVCIVDTDMEMELVQQAPVATKSYNTPESRFGSTKEETAMVTELVSDIPHAFDSESNLCFKVANISKAGEVPTPIEVILDSETDSLDIFASTSQKTPTDVDHEQCEISLSKHKTLALATGEWMIAIRAWDSGEKNRRKGVITVTTCVFRDSVNGHEPSENF